MTTKPAVLFVDDDLALLSGLRRVLKQEPYHIMTASSGEAGLAMIDSNEIEVVVSDESMPGMDGVEFLSIVARDRPSIVRMMLTGKATMETAIKAINEGQIYRFITKPCSEIELGLHIRQAIQHRALLTQARRMLGTLRMQASYIKHLENETPGISRVKRDAAGAILLDEMLCDTDTLLREIEKELSHE